KVHEGNSFLHIKVQRYVMTNQSCETTLHFSYRGKSTGVTLKLVKQGFAFPLQQGCLLEGVF
ncbi:hypothetical protein P7M41_26105, partial [Vibrio parahaemolyticus]|nr:hypothetical protein [Vibrio parahaemolyticus]